MKKILFTTIAIFVLVTQNMAQKIIDVYKDGNIVGSMFSADIDSVNITGNNVSSRRINFWNSGFLTNSFSVSMVDSIKVFHSEDEPLVYLGILGFNQGLYSKAIDVLASSTSGFYTSFVRDLTRKDGSLLYHGVEHALDMLAQYDFSTPLNSVNLITFTDGLDQGSLMMNPGYMNDEDYLSTLNQRIESMCVRGLPITAYSLGLLGDDVTSDLKFHTNLRKLATSEDKAIEVTNMSDVQNRLQEIADQIISISNRQTISMRIPGQGNATRVCFTFDGKTPENSSLYIEGTFNLTDRSLRNVSYHGIRATSGSMVMGTQDGIFVTFTFTNMQRIDGNGLIPTNDIRQYNQVSGLKIWQINSEFIPANNTQTTITHSGAAILLVLDCSNSLGAQFSNMKSYAQDFIMRVAGNAANFTINPAMNLMATMDNDDFAINISWDVVKHAESYTIYRSNSSSNGFTKVAEGITGTFWQDDTPLPGNNYYQIYAVGHGLTSQASSPSNLVKYEMAAPQNVMAAIDNDDFSINVSWNVVKHAESYTIYRSKSSSNGFVKVAEGVSGTCWQDDAPLPGNNYYQIYAMGHGLTSQASSPSNLVKYEIAAPTNVVAALDGKDFVINVTWDAVKYAESYIVYRSNSSSNGFVKVAEGISGTYLQDDAPLPGNNYYQIYAMGHGLTSQASSPSNLVKYEIAAPTNVVAALDDKDFVINVTWDAVKYAESYIVYRSNSSSNGFVKVAEGVSGTYWQDNSPLPGNNYYWIYATSHNITSPASNTSKVVKYEMAAPTNVVATLNDKDFVINVTWDVVKYAESYIVYRNGSQVAKDITSTNWRDDSPLQGGNYYVIIAVSHGIMSSFSSPSETIRYELSSPQNVMAALDDKDFVISVSWNAVKHAEYYSVYRSKESNTDFTKVADNLTTTTWYDLEPLPGNNYYQIYAMGHGIASRASSSTDAVKCEIAAPANVIATLDNTNFFVDVTWDAVKYAESYIVYRNGSQVAKDITSTNWRDNSPRKDENYYVIYAVGHGMTSEGSTSNIIRISDPVNHPPVDIVYNGSSANLHIPSSIAKDVTAHVSGAHVTINNNNTTEEIEFVLSGTSTNGSLTYNGSYKCKFILNGLTLTSKTGAAIDIESGKRSDLILMEGTTNTLEDAALGTQKACLYCDGHLEISGGGSLIVKGNAKHAIATNEYMQLKKTTGAITITKAASDAIHAEQYFQMNGGVLNISGMVGDGIQAEAKVNKVVENNGEVIIKGGSITIAVTSNDTKGIKSDADIHISGGTFNIAASGAGSKGISCNGNMFINEDDNTTAMTITASGRIYTDANGNDSRCMGIKVDGNLTISAGTITVYNTGSGSRGIKVDGTYTKSGTAKVNASVKN